MPGMNLNFLWAFWLKPWWEEMMKDKKTKLYYTYKVRQNQDWLEYKVQFWVAFFIIY